VIDENSWPEHRRPTTNCANLIAANKEWTMSVFGGADTQYPRPVRRLRLGIVGGGRGGLVGEWHATGVRLSNRWDIVAGALSSKPENAKASAKDWMIPEDRAYTDYREMADKESKRPDGIEAVSICTPNHLHYPMAKAFLEAGIDVVLDKPMTTTVADSEALVALQKKTGLVLGLTHPYVFHPMARQAKHMIANGAIGEIRQVAVEYLQDWGTEADLTVPGVAWRQKPETAGRASATGDIGTHAYHAMHYITGLGAREVRADFHNCGSPKPMEDTAFIKMKLDNGAPGHIWVTQAAPGNYCGLRIRVFGTKGGIEWDQEFPEHLKFSPLNQPEQTIVRGHGNGVLPAAQRLVLLPRGHGEGISDAWGNLYTEMALAIEERRGLREKLPIGYLEYATAIDGLRGVKFVDACADSHEKGGTWESNAIR
jgi:predicted dehydrogenase